MKLTSDNETLAENKVLILYILRHLEGFFIILVTANSSFVKG